MRYIKSFRLFFGRMPLRPIAVFGAAMAVFSVLIALPDISDGSGDFLAGMVEGMSVMIGTVASMVGVMLMIGLYNSCSPELPGYKYFRSIPDSVGHLRRGIVAASVLSLVTGVVLLALVGVISGFMGLDMSGVVLGALLLPLATGACNFTGFFRRSAARLGVMFVIMCGSGFIAGFTVGNAEDKETSLVEIFSQNRYLLLAVFAVSVVVYIAGLVYAVCQAKRKWGSEPCAR